MAVPPPLGASDDESEEGAPAALDAAALKEAAATLDGLLESPDWLLDPSTPGAKSAAEVARRFVKLFHDSARAHGPSKLHGSGGMVVDGFDHEQIWEELDLQNIPLRRHLRGRIAKLAEAPDGVSLAAPRAAEASAPAASSTAKASKEATKSEEDGARGKKAKRAKEEEEAPKAQGSDSDAEGAGLQRKVPGGEFFSWDDYDKFADMADAKIRLEDDADDSDFGLLEDAGAGDSEDEEAKNATFADFFDAPAEGADEGGEAPKGKRKAAAKAADDEEEEGGDNEGEEEELAAGSEAGNLSEEEQELEKKIREMQAAGDGGDEGEESEAGGVTGEEEGAASGDEEAAAKKGSKSSSLYELDKRLRSLEDEVAKLEEEQLEERPWLLKGEVSAKQRPLNSLLEVHLDQPMSHFAGRRAEDAASAGPLPDDIDIEDVQGGEAVLKRRGFDVDAIIRQRVWDEAFDDVVRKKELPPSMRPQGNGDDLAETLNFEKSRVGLGDVYAKQYEAELLGHKTEGEEKEDQHKKDTKELFATVMFKLDLLTNAHFTPRPPMIGTTADGRKIPSLKMEETIPLLVSHADLKAPEELRAPRRHERDHEELTHDEKVAARRAKKAHRKKVLHDKVESGEMSLKGMRERSKVLGEKNAEAKKEKAAKGTPKDQTRKRLKASELLAQAAEHASSGVSRKEDVRRERERQQKELTGGNSSKRLKL